MLTLAADVDVIMAALAGRCICLNHSAALPRPGLIRKTGLIAGLIVTLTRPQLACRKVGDGNKIQFGQRVSDAEHALVGRQDPRRQLQRAQQVRRPAQVPVSGSAVTPGLALRLTIALTLTQTLPLTLR